LAEVTGTSGGCAGAAGAAAATGAVVAGAVDAEVCGRPVEAQPVTSANASIAALVAIFIGFPDLVVVKAGSVKAHVPPF
jgi:hypothetical protein